MNAYSFSFAWRGRRYCFIPNQGFWALLLLVFASLLGWAASLGATHWMLLQQLDALHNMQEGAPFAAGDAIQTLFQQIEPAADEEEANQLAPQIIVALTALVSLILRKLIDWFLKLNNVLALAGQRMDAIQVRPIQMKVGKREMSFKPSRHFWKILSFSFLLLVGTIAYLSYSQNKMQNTISLLKLKSAGIDQIDIDGNYKDDIVGYLIDYFNEYEANERNLQQNFRDKFLMQKQLLVSKYLIEEKVGRVDQLSEKNQLRMNEKVSDLFKELVLKKIDIEPHVYEFFTDEEDLDKIETALMEQSKFHVPASITLAQAALETAYGRRVMHNNYFGIKDKDNSPSGNMTTTEYYNAKEVSLNKSKIISKQKVVKGGKTLYKCTIKDSFMRYNSAWASFRAHSVYLSTNNRYYALFTGGRNYEAWAEKIGSTKYGGVGYATSPIYGELLKKIVKRYGLDVLDY